MAFFKGQCHEIFYLYSFSWIEPIWTPDKQAKMGFLKICFREDIGLFCKYLCKNEFLSTSILACLSVARMGSIHKIKNCQKIL